MTRPSCPCCNAPVVRLQPSFGVVAVVHCGCWLTPEQAASLQRLLTETRRTGS